MPHKNPAKPRDGNGDQPGSLANRKSATGSPSPPNFARWSQLAAAGTLRPFRVSYAGLILVPTAAWAVLAYNDVVPEGQHIALPANIGVLYALSVILAVATLGFDLFCPGLIKRHRSYDQYIVHLGWYVREVGYVEEREREAVIAHARNQVAQLDDVPPGRIRELADAITGAAADRLRAPLSAELDEIVGRAARDWDDAETSFKPLRYAILGLYGFAALVATYLFFFMPVVRVVRALSGS